jgi:hypothetical protein
MPDAQKTTAFTVSFDDAALALRTGWIVAELRGRLNPDCAHFSWERSPEPPTLLLDAANERSPVEAQIEATKVLSSLGKNALILVDIKTISRSDKWGGIPRVIPAVADISDLLRYLVCRLIHARLIVAQVNDPDVEPDVHATLATAPIQPADPVDQDVWWSRIEWLLWAWDEALQDQLAAGNFGTASAYQLGRGLSECYWAMTPPKTLEEYEAPWDFLLGPNRVDAFHDLLRRLGPVFSDYAAGGVEFSITEWAKVAKAPTSYDRADLAIAQQVAVWRDLLVTGRDPLTLVESKRLETVARDPRPILKAFVWEIVAALAMAALFGLALAYWGGATKTVLAALATVGITTSAILSWIKSRAQSVATRVGTAVNQSVVNDTVTVLPKLSKPTGVRARIERMRFPLDSLFS